MSKGTHTSELQYMVEEAQRVPSKVFLIPAWLEDALEAHQLTKRALIDKEVIHSILTVDDINFYRQQVSKAQYKLSEHNILPSDISLSYLHSNAVDEYLSPERSLYEENTSFSDVIAPFIQKAGGCSVTCAKDIMIHNVYPSFEIFTELNLVCVTFKVADTLEIKDLVVKEYEKYVSYLINRFGIKCVSMSETFKNVINAKSFY